MGDLKSQHAFRFHYWGRAFGKFGKLIFRWNIVEFEVITVQKLWELDA